MIFGSIGLKNPCSPLAPPPPWEGPWGGGGYSKMKIKVIFGFPTIENPRIDITHDIKLYRTQHQGWSGFYQLVFYRQKLAKPNFLTKIG